MFEIERKTGKPTSGKLDCCLIPTAATRLRIPCHRSIIILVFTMAKRQATYVRYYYSFVRFLSFLLVRRKKRKEKFGHRSRKLTNGGCVRLYFRSIVVVAGAEVNELHPTLNQSIETIINDVLEWGTGLIIFAFHFSNTKLRNTSV